MGAMTASIAHEIHQPLAAIAANANAGLRWLARSWKFVSAEEFAALVSGDEPVRGRNLLLTFDDGFASNRRVAERVGFGVGVG